MVELADTGKARLAGRGEAGWLTRALANLEETVASAALLDPLVQATGGGVVALSDGIPDLRTVAPGRNAHGAAALGDWIAITPRDAASVTGLERRPLLPGWAWLLLVSGLILTGWLREGRAGKAAPIVPASPG